jgi:D-glucosaminate-6-phosphate ammonia-lyase
VERDHAAEWKEWIGRCQYIADRVSKIPGVTASVKQEPDEGLSNRSPSVTLRWESAQLGITGQEVSDVLYNTEPRVTLNAGPAGRTQDAPGDTGISIVVSMTVAGEEKIVAQRISDVLAAKHALKPEEAPASPIGDVSGRWQVEIHYTAGTTIHGLHLRQEGNRLTGVHQGDFLMRDISGSITGDAVSLASNVTERHGDALTYRFKGKVAGDSMSGALDLGEYRTAAWTAKRPEARA